MLRLVFMGTPDFAVPALAELIAAGHEIAAVYTQPPRPAGRGQQKQASPVETYARGAGLTVRSPTSLKTPEAQGEFASLGVDVAVVVAYGLILPRPVLDAPALGCFNIHASILPRWRGAAPIQRAILAGDTETGVAIMRMEAGLDTGPVALMERMAIGPRENAGSLHDRLAAIGASLIVRALSALERGTLTLTPQPADGVTYATKIDKAETRLDWREPALMLERKVRGFGPHPGAWFTLDETRIRVLAADVVEGRDTPGTVLNEKLTIACGEGALRLITVQRAGKAPMSAADFLRGTKIARGASLI